MSLFDISSSIEYLFGLVNSDLAQEVLSGGGGRYLTMTRKHDGDIDEETLTEMLMWELEGQMKRRQQEKQEKSVSDPFMFTPHVHCSA